MTDPLHAVVAAEVTSSESHSRRWQLSLDCGHTEYRPVKYRPVPGEGPRRGVVRERSAGDILPAPRRVQCWRCGRGT